jgi:glycosyltransferase involved in cell wall biosynthesis
VFRAFHGADIPGTQAVNGPDLSGFDHKQMSTIPFSVRIRGTATGLPLCPLLPWHLARFRPDVILAEGNSNLLNNVLVFAYAVIWHTPVVFWTLGELRKKNPPSRTQRMFRWITHWMESRSAALLGYSSLAIDYFDRQGYPKERQFRAVNCVDTDCVLARLDAARGEIVSLRRSLGLENKRVLLYVGAITAAKRLDDLIAVHARLQKRYENLALLIVGDGSDRQEIEQFAASQGAADVIFTGRVVDGVSGYFLLGDIFVLPSLGGLAISEAMIHGLPIVVTEADGCEVDLVEDGKNGHILPVGDRQALEECLASMLDDPERMKSMGEHSQWIIEHRFNIHTYMENVVAALEHAFKGR